MILEKTLSEDTNIDVYFFDIKLIKDNGNKYRSITIVNENMIVYR